MIYIRDTGGDVDAASIGLPSNPLPVECLAQARLAVRKHQIKTGQCLQIVAEDDRPHVAAAAPPPAPVRLNYAGGQLAVKIEFTEDLTSVSLLTPEGVAVNTVIFSVSRSAGGRLHTLQACSALELAGDDRRRSLLRLYVRRHVRKTDRVELTRTPSLKSLELVFWPAFRAIRERVTIAGVPLQAVVSPLFADFFRGRRVHYFTEIDRLLNRHRREVESIAAGLLERPSLSEEQHAELLTYGIALASLPDLEGFPMEFTWPCPPDFLPLILE